MTISSKRICWCCHRPLRVRAVRIAGGLADLHAGCEAEIGDAA